MVRGSGVRDIAEVKRVSIGKVLRTLSQSKYYLQTRQSHYETLEVDEFWAFVGNKQNKQWLIYAYHRETGEVVAYVWGKRDLVIAKRLKRRLKQLGGSYTCISSDNWDSFVTTFKKNDLRKRSLVSFDWVQEFSNSDIVDYNLSDQENNF